MPFFLLLLLSLGLVFDAVAQPAAATSAAAPAIAASAAPAADAPTDSGPRFALLEFEIEGNSVLGVMAVEVAVTPFLGPDRSLADVEKAREALERAYQGAGFLSVFVDIPEQKVDSGVVRLRVVEGRVDRLAVSGSRYYDQGFIRRGVPALAPGTVPDFNQLQAQLGTLNRDERQLQPVLRPGRTPGTVDAELKVTDKLPLTAAIELNNRHAADTDPWRLQASLRYDNLFQRDHSIALTAITAPRETQQTQVVSANYTAPLAPDWTALAYTVWSDSEVEPLGVATVFGRGLTLGGRAIRQFGNGAHTVAFGADYKNMKERLQAGTGELSTPLRYLPFTATYTGNWIDGRALTTLTSNAVLALRSILARNVDCPGNVGPVDQFACKREGADGGFAYWRGDLRHTRPLLAATGLPGTLALRAGWQLAGQPLVSAEQYVAGGADTVRGYLEAEGSGDDALFGSAEWRSPSLWGGTAGQAEPDSIWRIDELTLLAFVDAARLRTRQPGVGQASRLPLLGSGFGLRLKALRQMVAELDLAWPLKDTANTVSGEPRLHVRVGATF